MTLAIFSLLLFLKALRSMLFILTHVQFKLFNLGSLSVNVSANTGTGRSEFVNAGELSGSASLRDVLTKTGVLAFFMHTALIYYLVLL